MEITYTIGIPEIYRKKAVLLFEEAFGEKLSVAVRNKKLRLNLFTKCFDLKYGIAAIYRSQLVGIAGFSVEKKSLTSKMKYSDLIENIGFLKGNWAAFILGLYERKADKNQLLMDGISVDMEYRGHGIGEKLLTELISYAKTQGYKNIRLDVINTNPRAKKLYEKIGFVVIGKDRFPYLKLLLGFSGSEELIYRIESNRAG